MVPGDRVTEAGRTSPGRVAALRPQGMVDVQYPGCALMRRPAASLRVVRKNNGMASGPVIGGLAHLKANNGARFIVRVMAGKGDRYDVVYEDSNDWAYGVHMSRLARIPRYTSNPRTAAPTLASAYLDRVALAIYEGKIAKGAAEGRATLSSAYAIATKQLQKTGYFIAGTKQLTPKGELRATEKMESIDAGPKARAIEHVLAGARKAQGYRVVRSGAKFVVEPSGVRFDRESDAWAYAERLGPVSPAMGAAVRIAAQRAGATKKAVEKAKKLEVVRTAADRFEITGTTKWFSTKERALDYVRRQEM